MTTLADDLRNRLDHQRIRQQAEFVAHGLFRLRQPVLLGYCPGNSTCYSLVFTPTSMLERFGPAGPPDNENQLFVSWLEHGAYLFDFQEVPAPNYILEKLDRRAGLSDAIALHELFTQIQEAA